MSKNVFYVVRYLPPKTFGDGEITLSVSVDGTATLEMLRGRFPDAFERDGVYTLAMSTDDQITVKAERRME